MRLRFGGAENLDKALRSYTLSGDKAVSMRWWRARMDALRIMRLQDEFELVALDYCVTYEVSPPAWADARCEFISDSRSLVGNYVTALDMAGCSITVMRLDAQLAALWDAPVHTAALRW